MISPKRTNVIMAILALVLATGAISLMFQSVYAAGSLYVASQGNDSNDCISINTPCATINSAIVKAEGGETIYVANGVYTSSTGNEVILINKDVTLSGGWSDEFLAQNGKTIIDGQDIRRGITVIMGVSTSIDHFTITNGFSQFSNGGGIYNEGNLKLLRLIITQNSAPASAGGGIFTFYGSITITNSSIVDNTSWNSGGGIFNIGGSATLVNSMVARNQTSGCGGGIYNVAASTGHYIKPSDLLLLNSSVIQNEAFCGGGITTEPSFTTSVVALQNSILADNIASVSHSTPDCYGPVTSLGYNLIEDVSGCAYVSTSGDLLDVNAGVIVIGNEPALVQNSVAIDAGNPAGCTDSQGNALTKDLRSVLRPLDGNQDGNARCDIGAYEFDVNNPIHQTFLPLCTNNFCPDFFDDFSNSSSGWVTKEDDFVRTEYLGGEYRVLSKQAGYFHLFRAPACARQSYIIEGDIRWVGLPGNSYGVVFGITSDFSQFYLFDMNTDFQMYRIYRYSSGSFTPIVTPKSTTAIHGGIQSNHIKITRDNDQIILEINGVILGIWIDNTITGLTGVGVISSSYSDDPISDARFDNFRITTIVDGNVNGQRSEQPINKYHTFSVGLESDYLFTQRNYWYPMESP